MSKEDSASELDSDSLFTKFHNKESVLKSGKHINLSKQQHWHIHQLA